MINKAASPLYLSITCHLKGQFTRITRKLAVFSNLHLVLSTHADSFLSNLDEPTLY